MENSEQKPSFEVKELRSDWLTPFFQILLSLFEPMLTNPFSLKILYGINYHKYIKLIIQGLNNENIVSNNPSEILSNLQIDSSIFYLIKEVNNPLSEHNNEHEY